ncbi:MAG: hypothetical protein IJN16_00590 [Lachnospiraceae bacterium]|nr:hypothetical protein [Lachnospiraceae bacterium]
MTETVGMTDKQYIGVLIDQLAMLERLEKQALKGTDTETLELIQLEIRYTKQKLYEPTPNN